MLSKDSTGDKGEGDNLNISIRSYFMQTACSAGRKKKKPPPPSPHPKQDRTLPLASEGKDT